MLRCVSAHHCCGHLSDHIILWPLTTARCFHPQSYCSLDGSVFQTILCKLERLSCVKIPRDQLFLKHSNQLAWHQKPCHGQSHWDHVVPHSDVWLWILTEALKLNLHDLMHCAAVKWFPYRFWWVEMTVSHSVSWSTALDLCELDSFTVFLQNDFRWNGLVLVVLALFPPPTQQTSSRLTPDICSLMKYIWCKCNTAYLQSLTKLFLWRVMNWSCALVNLCSPCAGIRREEKPCSYYCPQKRRAWLLNFRRKKSPSTKSSKWHALHVNDKYDDWSTANTTTVVCVDVLNYVQVFSSFWGSSEPIISRIHTSSRFH